MKVKDIILKGVKTIRSKQYKVGSDAHGFIFKYSTTQKSLYIKALVRSGTNNSTTYQVSLILSGIPYSLQPDKKKFPVSFEDDKLGTIYLQQPTIHNDIRIRCMCADDYFMWQYPNKLVKALNGPFKPYVRKTKNYPRRNPDNVFGCCKHTIAVLRKLMQLSIIKPQQEVLRYFNTLGKRK